MIFQSSLLLLCSHMWCSLHVISPFCCPSPFPKRAILMRFDTEGDRSSSEGCFVSNVRLAGRAVGAVLRLEMDSGVGRGGQLGIRVSS
jgi:hypothetical protein